MQYRKDKQGQALSILGFGCMRFPRTLGQVDMKKTEALIVKAVEAGVNYFDTAYIYPGSEAALGKILEEHQLRQKVHIATKLPHYLIKSLDRMEAIFQEELQRLRTDRVDYYLMHMLADVDTWQRLTDLGIREWIAEKKASGQIGQIGFSYHGNADMFCRLVDAYDWDFCQIQYNYMDEHSQAGRRGLDHAAARGLPVIIMEPLRGGKLVTRLPQEAKSIFHRYPVKGTPARWAFHWLWDQEKVTVVLSGMNDMAILEENLQSADDAKIGAFGDAEQQMLRDVVNAINAKIKVGCTGCGYCMPCPKGVDIPGTFAAYNRRYSEGKFWGLKDYAMCTACRKNSTAASNCVGCGLCETRCPQSLPIRQHLQEAKKELEVPVYKVFRKAVTKFVKF